MFLCIDVGNSNIAVYGFVGDKLLFQFRGETKSFENSDQIGMFILSMLKNTNVDISIITKVGVASVVPSFDYSLKSACVKYLNITPVFLKIEQPYVKVKIHNPNELGLDIMAGAIASSVIFPKQNVIIFDVGTATTCSYINKDSELLGVSIAPGIKTMLNSLVDSAAKLTLTEIDIPKDIIGKNTASALKSGIFYAQVGFINESIKILNKNNDAKIIATGGFAYMLEEYIKFDKVIPELVAIGIKKAII